MLHFVKIIENYTFLPGSLLYESEKLTFFFGATENIQTKTSCYVHVSLGKVDF